MAHFLEADLQPWGAALANALFAPDAAQQPTALVGSAAAASVVSSVARRDSAWRLLDELRPLHGAVDAVLCGWQGPLLEQLPLTPAEWQPALIGARAIDGRLELSFCEAMASCDAMPTVRGVHTLILRWSDAVQYLDDAAVAQRACTAVASLSTLRTLEVGTAVSDAVAHSLAAALTRLTELQALRLEWEDDTIAVLARPLGLLTTLTRLDLSISEYEETAAVLAPALTCLSCLADLTLRCGDPGEVTVLAGPLGTLTTLTSLNLSDSGVDVDAYEGPEGVECYHDAEALALGLRHLSQLAALNLRCAFDSPGGAAALAPAVSQLTALTVLDLVSDRILADDAAALAPALSRLSRLAYLDLRSNTLGAAGAAALAPSLALLTALTSLQLGDNDVGANGAASLARALSRLSRLADLDLSSNELGAAGAAALAPSIALLTALTQLRLNRNDVGANGAAALAPALSRLSRLADLNLDSNAIGAAGAAALAPPFGCLTTLLYLGLSLNDIGDEGVQHLASALARLTHLKRLRLGMNSVHDSAVDALRARLPASVWEVTDLHRRRSRAAPS